MSAARHALLLLLLLLAACASENPAPVIIAPLRKDAPPRTVVKIYEGALQGEWQDHGWAPRAPPKEGHAQVVMTHFGGWILTFRKLRGSYGGVVFRFRAPAAWGDFLDVRVDSETADIFPRVPVGPRHRRALEQGWTEVFVPMAELNPTFARFDRVIIRARTLIPEPGVVELDNIGLTEADPLRLALAESLLSTPGLPAVFSVDCDAPGTPISPLIYGIAYSPRQELATKENWKVEPTARRWGGNSSSRYNWELGNAWNASADYYFENLDFTKRAESAWEAYLDANRAHRVKSAITLPMIGWVAKDTTSVGFPVKELGAQQDVDPYNANAGNGLNARGHPIASGPPTFTSIAATPEFIAQWVRSVLKAEGQNRSVEMYILDNEPALWHDTHRDVHPNPVTYDELVERTIRYGSAVRAADPQALIAGPAEWGFTGYLYSAADAVAGFNSKPDRLAHGDQPLIEWYLHQLAEHEKKTGVKVLDVLDLHYYPQAKGVGVGAEGLVDDATNALRIRSTRSLWDPRYLDESWIHEPVQLIPRMKGWVARNYPGLKLSIGEYNFGAERHMSGGLALAEALGRFGQLGLYSAFYWTYPPEGSPAFWAFRAYRDFDGKGAAFEQVSLPTEAARDASAFAARSPDGRRITVLLLNFSPTETLEANVSLKGCPLPDTQRLFTFVGNSDGFSEQKGTLSKARLPPYSITVMELAMPRKK
ncbi:MAG: glycoside hydrolase family 44 protein [Archangiaceae bacterium]|nr:glycoside hydrolase family 44 protein [Archangiaceae bacterium]